MRVTGRSDRWAQQVALARVRLEHVLRRALLGPVGSAVPDTGARTIEEFRYDPEIEAHVLEQRPLCDPAIVHYDFPPDFPPQFRRSKAFDGRSLYRLRDVLVSPHTGLIWTPEGRILEESVGSLRRVQGWGRMLHEPLLPARPLRAVIRESGPVVCCAPTNYFHWLTEAVPALLAAWDAVPEARLLLPRRVPRYMEDLLGLLLPDGAGSDRVVRADGVLRTEEVLLPAIDPFSGFVHPAEVELLRRTFAPHLGQSSGEHALYVSRRRASARRLRGEEELETRLRARGFEIVFCEELSLPEQMKRFATAGTIVAPHGAGLANLVWAARGARLVEIFPADDFNDCYARLAVARGLRYAFVTAMPDPASSGLVSVPEVLDALGG